MADNIGVKEGVDRQVATDQIGGIDYQRVKIGSGADGTYNDATAANPIPTVAAASDTLIGAVNETAPASDTASSGINGRLQRIAQRITALLPTSIGQKAKTASLSVVLASDSDALPTTVSGVATAAGQTTSDTLIGAVAETSPTLDTDPSGLNGGLKRLAQRLSTLIGLLPSSIGQKVMTNSVSVALSSNHSNVPVLPASLDITSATLTGTGTLFSQDVTGYAGIMVQVTSAGGGSTIQYEVSNDNTTWYQCALGGDPISPTSGFPLGSSTTLRMLYFPITSRYFRARVSTFVSGSVIVIAHLISNPVPGFIQQTNINTQTNVTGATNQGSGGLAKGHVVAAGSGDAQNIKNTAARLYGYNFFNKAITPCYVKFHNTTGTPTAGASVFLTIGIPAGGAVRCDNFIGMAFSSGIGLTIVTGSADADATGVTAGDVVGDVWYA